MPLLLARFLLSASLLLSSLVAASPCNIQVTGSGGIGLYQDDLGKHEVLVWKAFYAQETGTTFFSVIPSDVIFTIVVLGSFTESEAGFQIAPPGSAWRGSVDNRGAIGDITSAGTCSSPGCVAVTVDSTTGFGSYSVWVRLYKAGVIMANYSLPFPGTATFQIDQSKLYFIWDQKQDQVPVTDNMRARSFQVDLTACNAAPTPAPPMIFKFFPTTTSPYYTVERPVVDPLGSSCGPAHSPDCASVTFHGQYFDNLIAIFVKDQQWLDHKYEEYRPIVWQRLVTSSKKGMVYSFPYDEQLFVAALIFTSKPVDELTSSSYIITGLHPAQPGQVFNATLDDGGIPQLALSSATSAPNTITLRASSNWRPKYVNTSLVVMKNGCP